MSVLLVAHEDCLDHLAGPHHPERPDRLGAIHAGVLAADLRDALIPREARPAQRAELLAVHDAVVLDRADAIAAAGGGALDPDTVMSLGSHRAALLAAGAGLVAVEALREGVAPAAFCAVRPPGHHATPSRSMGFCLFNNVAVTAAMLAAAGENVLIVDYDAHHGNGTQEIFYADERVFYLSFHQYPCYPGTGALEERGAGAGRGYTLNLPLPAGATGDVYRRAWFEVALPAIEDFQPTWLLLSAGFDAHRADPLTTMGLSAGDFAELTADVASVAPPGRTVAFLEGGYDLDALAASAGACLAVLAGADVHSEPATVGGPGAEVIAAALEQSQRP